MTTNARLALRRLTHVAVVALRPLAAREAQRQHPLSEGPFPDVKAAYPTLRRQYRTIIYGAVSGYLEGSGSVTRWTNLAGRAVLDYFSKAFYRGYTDAGGAETEPDDETWLTVRAQAELGFVAEMFAALKAKRMKGADGEAEANARADAYAATLDGVYSEGKLRGKDNVILTLKRRPGEAASKDPCAECKRYEGKRHSAKWWRSRGLVERPNPKYGCGRFEHCKHSFFTDDGKMYAY